MKAIFGLGNPGTKYDKTRHNIGFMFLDYFASKNSFGDFESEDKFKALVSSKMLGEEKVILLKPQTYMNLSGESILKLMSFYKISKNDIVIISDDVSMELGKIRLRNKGSAGGHNGLKSIIEKIGDEFNRIKIGVGYDSKYELEKWVLGKFSDDELLCLNEIFNDADKILLKLI